MGGIIAKPKDATRSKDINKQLEKAKQELDQEIKLLLLGPGESGKSTLLKQMKLLHLGGFSQAERQQFRDICRQHVLSTIKLLIKSARSFEYKFSKSASKNAKAIEALNSSDTLTPEHAKMISNLWLDSAIQKTFARYAELPLTDSTKYYMDAVDRIAADDYLPSDEDILRVRAKTTGITEISFNIDDAKFRLVDVGGQRSERKKWIHCFAEVNAILFVVALSEYDLMLHEDQTVRRPDESMQLFDEMCNSEVFKTVPLVLFLNKTDLFRAKLAQVDLSVCFPDYKGGSDYDKACKFYERKFLALNQQTSKQIHVHYTCATDTENIGQVFNSLKSTVLTMDENN